MGDSSRWEGKKGTAPEHRIQISANTSLTPLRWKAGGTSYAMEEGRRDEIEKRVRDQGTCKRREDK